MRPSLLSLTGASSLLSIASAWSNGIAILDADINVDVGVFVCLPTVIYATLFATIGEQPPSWRPTTVIVRPTSWTSGNGGCSYSCSPTTVSGPVSTTVLTTSITVTTTNTLAGTTITITGPTSTEETTHTVSATVTQSGTTVTAPPATITPGTISTASITTTLTVSGSLSTLPGSTVSTTITLPGPSSAATSVATAPGVTLTASVSTVSTTAKLSICPSRIVNPTYTPPGPLPSDYTWGCPPGFLCHIRNTPEDGDCNFEASPPADHYFCSPDECIPSPKLLPDQYWGPPVKADEISKFNVTPGYFNLDPTEFGLNYSIFAFPEGTQVQKRNPGRGDPSLQSRQAGGADIIPGVCYDECNNCMLEAEAAGKSAALCDSGSAFNVDLGNCNACIAFHSAGKAMGGPVPQFQQYLSYCETVNSGPPPPSLPEMVSTSTTSSTSGVTTIQPTSYAQPTNLNTPGSAATSSLTSTTSSLPSSSTTPPTITSTPSNGITAANPSTQQASAAGSRPAISSSSSDQTTTVPFPSNSSAPLFEGASPVSLSSLPLHWLVVFCAIVGLLVSFL